MRLTAFDELPVGARFTDGLSPVVYEKITPVVVGPQGFNAAIVNEADVVRVYGVDSGPGYPYERVSPRVPRYNGRALSYWSLHRLVKPIQEEQP